MKLIWDYLSLSDRLYLLAQVSLGELSEELHRRAQQPPEEENEEDEEEEFKFQDISERMWAFNRLIAKYPHEEARILTEGAVKCPLWLKKEILERRKEGCNVSH